MPRTLAILGGGFAGLAALDTLWRLRESFGDYRIVLVDRSGYATFAPTLPDIVSGRIRPRHMAFPLAPHCRRLGAQFIEADVEGIDAATRTIETTAGPLRADSILLALGCENNYFGNRDAQRNTLGLKTVADGIAMAQAVTGAVRAKQSASAGAPPTHFVIVGGGYTGIEIAAHVAYALNRQTGLAYRDLKRLFPVTVVELGDEILRNTSDRTRAMVYAVAKRFGVAIRTGTSVERFHDGQAVTMTTGETIENARVFWSAGVTPGPPAARLNVPKALQGRLGVDDCLRIEGHEAVFAAGDVAAAHPPGSGAILRLSIQFAISGGKAAAGNMVRLLRGRPLKPFRPRDPGYLVPLAPGFAAGVILGMEFSGTLPFLAHYGLCVGRSWGWANRLGLLMDLLGRGA